ncbi:MAG TPA: CmcI family methyltransferase [Terriglobia bacterium]|nr:CmcI family methyltransferase [Terriglobia bacterium]
MARTIEVKVDYKSENIVLIHEDGASRVLPLYSEEAFREISRLWVNIGWALKYSYGFTWLGRPIIQLPEDMLRIQEVIYRIKPDVILETGVAHGGSLIFYASLCKAMEKGRVIGVDIEIRPHNRKALEEHILGKRITLIEGSSIAPETAQQVRGLIAPGEKAMVILDSNHSKDHVRKELDLYGPLVSPGGYIVAADGIMEDLADVPGGRPEWVADNPRAAIREFLACHPEFEVNSEPTRLGITYWPDAYLRRK